jgi:hypothetical protein
MSWQARFQSSEYGYILLEHQTAGGVLTDPRQKRHKGTRHVAARTELFQCARIRTMADEWSVVTRSLARYRGERAY